MSKLPFQQVEISHSVFLALFFLYFQQLMKIKLEN